MNLEEIAARLAEVVVERDTPDALARPMILAVLREVVAAEREACAAICERIQGACDDEHVRTADPGCGSEGAGWAAKEIRARGS